MDDKRSAKVTLFDQTGKPVMRADYCNPSSINKSTDDVCAVKKTSKKIIWDTDCGSTMQINNNHSNSVNECIKLVLDPSRSSYADRDWSNANEIPAEMVFDRLFLDGERELSIFTNPKEVQRKVRLTFDAEMTPDYFASQSVTHDGTLIFELGAYSDICERVCMGTTQMVGKNIPEHCDVHYTVGNFIVLNEHDDEAFSTPEKPWICERITVILPLSYEIEATTI